MPILANFVARKNEKTYQLLKLKKVGREIIFSLFFCCCLRTTPRSIWYKFYWDQLSVGRDILSKLLLLGVIYSINSLRERALQYIFVLKMLWRKRGEHGKRDFKFFRPKYFAIFTFFQYLIEIGILLFLHFPIPTWDRHFAITKIILAHNRPLQFGPYNA